MRLSLFRQRMLQEVTEAERLLGASTTPNQMIQPILVSAAALLRKIMTRTGSDLPITVKEYPDPLGAPSTRAASLRNVCNWFLHYRMFLPAVDWGRPLDDSNSLCQILSDKDRGLSRRLVDTRDFLQAARRVAGDGRTLLPALVRNAKKKISRCVFGPPFNESIEIDAVESLIDVLDLARELRAANRFAGKIDTYHNFDSIEVNYTTLVDKLFYSWSLFPIGRQFQLHSSPDARIQGAMLIVHTFDDYDPRMIRGEDLLDFLDAIPAAP